MRHYVTICRTCGKRVKSRSERKRSNAVVYDASVKGLVVYLSAVQFLFYNRIASFFKEIFGLEISRGSMVNWINEAKKAAAPAIEKIKEYITQSAVVGFDETDCYCNKRPDWAWIAQTVYFTLVFHGKSRKGQELEDRFGDSLERMTAVTDRHSAYFALHFLNHQVCLAHLRKRYTKGIKSRQNPFENSRSNSRTPDALGQTLVPMPSWICILSLRQPKNTESHPITPSSPFSKEAMDSAYPLNSYASLIQLTIEPWLISSSRISLKKDAMRL